MAGKTGSFIVDVGDVPQDRDPVGIFCFQRQVFGGCRATMALSAFALLFEEFFSQLRMILRKFDNAHVVDDGYIGDIFKDTDFVDQWLRQFSVVRKHLSPQPGSDNFANLRYFCYRLLGERSLLKKIRAAHGYQEKYKKGQGNGQ